MAGRIVKGPSANWGFIRSLPSFAAAAAKHVTNLGVHFALASLTPRFPVFWLRGTARPSGRQATLLVAGKEPWVHYLPQRFFYGEPRREWITNASIWTLPGLLRRLRSSADLTIARVDRISARLFFGEDYLHVPEWILTDMEVPSDMDAYVRSSGNRAEDMRRVRRHHLRSVVSHDESDFDFFYHKMHLPYVRQRHGKLAFAANAAAWRRRFRRGGIIWVERDRECVAGTLFDVHLGVFYSMAVGTAGGEAQPLHDGALAATYLYGLDYARQHGCTRINYGGSRPSLHDGVLRYKYKWGVTIKELRGCYFDLLVHWNRPDDVVADFLSHTSLVFRDRGGLSAIHALKTALPATAGDVLNAHHTLWMRGLQRLYLFSAAGWEAGLTPPQGVVPFDPSDVNPFPWRPATPVA
jgi:hypothetical protein